ncbi:MAG: DNA mismatch repair protein MutS [Bdellovibrionales bacterium RIFOXYC1_FULL_54_43]|nr:MAG: DNA mismatch repair protein MutS [Bdellovibrionales bacterium RIFOXYC1_FULL_54_43]OFZ81833.1 MAG: DNA mismatch repair protein MutS [Bdellovibrionales bacterium RIFOXYD1_FULL_55_31]
MSSTSENPGFDTPLMKQYGDLKAQAADALLLFRMGDFYELFGEDAVQAARILEITLTTRDKNKPNPIPMCGVPHHSVQGYIQRLLKAGKKVAIGEQMEDPAAAKAGNKIVRREIVRTFTPGVQFDFEGVEANYLAVVLPVEGAGGTWILACLDASTGEAIASERLTGEALVSELGALPVRQLLRLPLSRKSQNEATGESELDHLLQRAGILPGLLLEDLPSNYLSAEQAGEVLRRQYGLDSLGAFLTEDVAIRALGIAVTYVLRTQLQERLAHLRLPVPLRRPKTLVLGPRTAQHLDLFPSADRTLSLYELLDRTRSALGARQLKHWMSCPLKEPLEITSRQSAVRELAGFNEPFCRKLAALLGEVYDLERISGRINTRLANPRDTLALGRSLATLSGLADAIAQSQSELLVELRTKLRKLSEVLDPLTRKILKFQRDDAPLVSRDGGIFNVGTSPELDRLFTINQDGQRWLLDVESRERQATGISSLKVRYNRVFGYYIEITQAHLKSVPPHYQRKQTMVGAERFFTEELKKFEDEIVNASARQKALELEIFNELLEEIQGHTPAVMEAARVLGEFDALLSLATLASEPGWVFPQIDDSLDFEIVAGRHPLVDVAMRGRFVPNDLKLAPSSRLTLIITGPNMGGKSTVMRQAALIVILGQMGAPVPAASARWGTVSSLYTRIGAHDAIARGQSTFMVEMSELAHILHHADERALVILDEIGRGTSTYDGISVAWAALEWICTRIRSRTLFATHYHELTRLADKLPLCANTHLAVEGARGEKGANLRFLYKLEEGATNDSFGIHVAQIAGLPAVVVQRAWSILEELEKHSGQVANEAGADLEFLGIEQLSLFSAPGTRVSSDHVKRAKESTEKAEVASSAERVLSELEKVDVNELRPIEALSLIAKLQEISRGSG